MHLFHVSLVRHSVSWCSQVESVRNLDRLYTGNRRVLHETEHSPFSLNHQPAEQAPDVHTEDGIEVYK